MVDQYEITFNQALDDYRKGLELFNEYKNQDKLNSDEAFQSVLQILMARDIIEKLNPSRIFLADTFTDLYELEQDFEKLKKYFYWSVRGEKKREIVRAVHIDEPPIWWKSIYWVNPIYILSKKYPKIFQPLKTIKNFFARILNAIKIALSNISWLKKLKKLYIPLELLSFIVFEKFDWLWKLVTVIVTSIALAILINITPKFWASGITPENIIGIIFPSLITILIGKDTLGQITNGYGVIEKNLKRFSIIPPLLRQEFALLSSILFLVFMIFCFNNLNNFSDCYYQRAISRMPGEVFESTKPTEPLCKALFFISGTGNAESKKSASQAENDFRRATALNPDHERAYLYLGWLYELRQDIKNAEAAYSLAMQNNSLLARVRLASLHIPISKNETGSNNLVKNDSSDQKISSQGGSSQTSLNRAATILMAKWRDAYNIYRSMPEKGNAIKSENGKNVARTLAISTLNELQNARSYFVTLAHVRLDQSRYKDSSDSIIYALEIHNKILEISQEISPKDRKLFKSTPALCIYGEYLRLNPDKEVQEKLLPPLQDYKKRFPEPSDRLDKVWQTCVEYTDKADPDDDLWLTRTFPYLPNSIPVKKQ
jgi:hypothetical protein